MIDSLFLTSEEVAILTGRKMALPFWINAARYPIVTVAAVEGHKEPAPKLAWRLKVLD